LYNRAVRVGAIIAWILLQPSAPPPPDTDIFLAPLSIANGAVTVGAPTNITNNPGYDNQPSFTPDGRSVLFTSIRGGTQTDIYRYDIPAGKLARVTDTPESEYSPTVTPDGGHISVIRVEADGTQRLWRFTIDGAQPELVLTDVKPASLQIADTRTGKADSFVPGINRSIQRIPGGRTISFVQRVRSSQQDVAPTLKISELDPTSHHVTPLVNAVVGAREADCAWTPDGMLLMADKDVLYGWRRGENDWRRLADLAALGLRGVSRLAVSPAGDRIALVTQAQQ
jgi:dipeptidyl aminopeptidase/acylaminoacyl peptidase